MVSPKDNTECKIRIANGPAGNESSYILEAMKSQIKEKFFLKQTNKARVTI